MEYLGRTPAPPLAAFIERIWYCSDAPPHARERVLPSGGTVDLVVNLVDDGAGSTIRTIRDRFAHAAGLRQVFVDYIARRSVLG